MKVRLSLKRLGEHIPYCVGRWTALTPFRLRLGADYSRFCKLIRHYATASSEEKYQYTIGRLNDIVGYAQANIPFYQALYGKRSIDIRSFSDFEKLPVITKHQAREYAHNCRGSMRLNTGGSTAGPLFFYVDKNVWAREWAHMHYIWAHKGYKHSDLMMTMLGRNIGSKAYQYNAIHNELLINPYVPVKKMLPDILQMFARFPIRFFQGYTSNIYNFFRELEPLIGDEEKNAIARSIASLFLSSEYPMPYMLKYLENEWGLDNYLSWYGLSEMCVLAFDKDSNGCYEPLTTYGYAEEVDGLLCGTSFHNYDMPLIRYSTEDLVEGERDQCGIMNSFRITRGRSCDFMEDKEGRKLSLTFAMGRHHKIYDMADFIQIYPSAKGKATFYVTFKREVLITESEAHRYFDLRNIDIDFDYVFVKSPIRTSLGKLKLKLNQEDVDVSECGREC